MFFQISQKQQFQFYFSFCFFAFLSRDKFMQLFVVHESKPRGSSPTPAPNRLYNSQVLMDIKMWMFKEEPFLQAHKKLKKQRTMSTLYYVLYTYPWSNIMASRHDQGQQQHTLKPSQFTGHLITQNFNCLHNQEERLAKLDMLMVQTQGELK